MLEQLKSSFKRTIKWNKYQPKYSDFLIDPSFHGVDRHFVLSFKNQAQRTSYKRYYLLTREIKNYVMIDGQNFFD